MPNSNDDSIQEVHNYLLATAEKYIRHDIRYSEVTLMSDSPFSLRNYDAAGWTFTWYSPEGERKWQIEDLFLDGECVYIGPKADGVKLITIKKKRQKLNINWNKRTITYKGAVDGFDTWGSDNG